MYQFSSTQCSVGSGQYVNVQNEVECREEMAGAVVLVTYLEQRKKCLQRSTHNTNFRVYFSVQTSL